MTLDFKLYQQDIKKFAEYFDAPMVKMPGKVFPVTTKYLASEGNPRSGQ